jgi:hypothetical protein
MGRTLGPKWDGWQDRKSTEANKRLLLKKMQVWERYKSRFGKGGAYESTIGAARLGFHSAQLGPP